MIILTPEEIISRVIYKDENLLVLNKPAGVPVHKGPKGGEVLEDYFDDLKFDLPDKPSLANRLDRETSGCLVLGRNAATLKKLGALFATNQIKKTYLAIVHGAPPETEGRIDLPMAKKSPNKNSWWMKVDPNGQPATTDYRALGAAAEYSVLELKPVTGRTHQLRVHCAATRCPIVGDKIYGLRNEADSTKMMALHSYKIEIPLYGKENPVMATANPPAHMAETLKDFGY